MEKNERYISTCIYVSSSSKRGFSFGNIVWKEKEREEKVRKISKTVQDESCGVGRGARRYIVGKGREGGCAAYSSLSHSLSLRQARSVGEGEEEEEKKNASFPERPATRWYTLTLFVPDACRRRSSNSGRTSGLPSLSPLLLYLFSLSLSLALSPEADALRSHHWAQHHGRLPLLLLLLLLLCPTDGHA